LAKEGSSSQGQPWPKTSADFMKALEDYHQDHQIVALSFPEFGHDLCLEIYRVTSDIIRARILHAWVKQECISEGGETVKTGFSGLEWFESEKCFWMDSKQLLVFFTDLLQLQNTVIDLTESELLSCLTTEPHNKMTRVDQIIWAKEMTSPEQLERFGLTMQPYSLSLFEDHANYLASLGFPEHLTIYTGVGTSSQVQLLDFPLSKACPIFQLTQKLFHENCQPYQFIKAIEWYNQPGGCSYRAAGIESIEATFSTASLAPADLERKRKEFLKAPPPGFKELLLKRTIEKQGGRSDDLDSFLRIERDKLVDDILNGVVEL